MANYKAAFIIPLNATKRVSDIGWEFESNSFLSDQVIDFLANDLNLQLGETYLGITNYFDEYIQASVFSNNEGKIEHVYIKAQMNKEKFVLAKFCKSPLIKCAEFFVP